MTDTRERIVEYDVAKGLGIILVILGHTLPLDSDLRIFIYSFHMPLFFFLSGLVMKEGKISCFDKSVFTNYIFYSAVYIAFDILVRGFIEHERSFIQIGTEIYRTVCFDGVSVLWFLGALFLGKFFVSLYSRKVGIISGCLISFLLFGVTAYISSYVHLLSDYKLIYYPLCSFCKALSMSSFILLGYISKPWITRMLTVTRMRGGYCLIGICIIPLIWIISNQFELVEVSGLSFGCWPVTFALSILGTVSTLLVSCLICRNVYFQKLLIIFGKHSLFIMATHEYLHINGAIDWAVYKFMANCPDAVCITIRALLLMGVEMVLSIIVAPYIERLIVRLRLRLFAN